MELNITIDMDKRCKECGALGALDNGLCLRCAFKKLREKLKTEKEEEK